MKRGALFASATLVCLMGAGCLRAPSPSVSVVVPEVRIDRPANGSQTDAASIDVAGTSNMPSVLINGNSHLVINGLFSVPVDLVPGANDISVQAENGYSTTTLRINITRTSL